MKLVSAVAGKFEVKLGASGFSLFQDLRLSYERAGNGFVVNKIREAAIDLDALADRETNGAVFDKFD
jgi:hypothetical protein